MSAPLLPAAQHQPARVGYSDRHARGTSDHPRREMHLMHVVSASRRTDIPAFYMRWFMERVRQGFALFKHPVSPGLHEVSLRPEDVIGIVFWTRNAAPLIPFLDELELRGFGLACHYTIVDLPRVLDERTPSAVRAVQTFQRLAERIGPNRVRWRYDPIVLCPLADRDYHRRTFERLARALEGHTQDCLTSFVEHYRKVKRHFAGIEARTGIPMAEPCLEEKISLAQELASIAAARGMRFLACCTDEIVGGGVGKARCIDPELISRWWPERAGPLARRPTRPECACVESRDIGAYDTCAHGCQYCYAVNDHPKARAYRRNHDPMSPCLGMQR
ncbi:MAG: DUF1848 domain-containing protein [Planctomycetota bacterium]